MDTIQEHTIEFTGLKDGTHQFDFDLGQPFFDAAAEDEFLGGQVKAHVQLEKSPAMLVTRIHLDGPVSVRCDHCNAPMDLHLQGEQRQIFRLADTEVYDDDELVSLPPNAHGVDLTHYFYECLRLALPVRHVHPPGQCDPEVEAVLGRLSVDNPSGPDPRWAALENLKNQRP